MKFTNKTLTALVALSLFCTPVGLQVVSAAPVAKGPVDKSALALAAINSASSARTMQFMLEVNARTLGINTGHGSDYATLSNRLAVATAVFNDRPAQGYADIASVDTEFNNDVTTEKATEAQTVMKKSVDAVNNAKSARDMEKVLEHNATALGISVARGSDYAALKDHLAVATAVFSGIPAGGYPDAPTIATAFNNAVTAEKATEQQSAVNKAVALINKAKSKGETKELLDRNATVLGLSVGPGSDYATIYDHVAIGAAVLAAKPAGGYTDAASIATAFDAAVATEKTNEQQAVVTLINKTQSPFVEKSLLEHFSALLGLSTGRGSDYASLTYLDRVDVATKVINDRPQDGYTDASSLKTEFDSDVTADQLKEHPVLSTDNSTVTAPQTATVGSAFTVAVVPVNTNGKPLGAGQTVVVSDGTTQVTATWNATTSQYEASFTESAAASVTFTATVNGTALTQTATTVVANPAGVLSADKSTVTAPQTATVGSAFTVAVVPVDTNGNPLGDGQTVVVSDGTTQVTATWNATTSQYEASFTESAAGSITFTATVNGTALTQTSTTTVS